MVARRRTGSPVRAGTPGRRRAGSPGPSAGATPGVVSSVSNHHHEMAPSPFGALPLDDGAIGAGSLLRGGLLSAASNAPASLSLVDALGRIAAALERGGGLGGGADDSSAVAGAAAAAAVVAAAASAAAEVPVTHNNSHGSAIRVSQETTHSNGMVTGGGVEDHLVHGKSVTPQLSTDLEARMARIEHSLAEVLQQGKSRERGEDARVERPKLSEIDALSARAERLEHEVAELRAQVARRLDAAARDAAVSRREAEEARAEASTLRSEVADLMAQILQAPPAAMSQRSDAASSVTSGPPITGRSGASAGIQDTSVRESMDAVDSGTMASPHNSGRAPCSNGEAEDAPTAQAGALPSSVKFVPAPLMAPENVSNGNGQGPGFSRQVFPSRVPPRGSLGRSSGSHAGATATSHAGSSAKH